MLTLGELERELAQTKALRLLLRNGVDWRLFATTTTADLPLIAALAAASDSAAVLFALAYIFAFVRGHHRIEALKTLVSAVAKDACLGGKLCRHYQVRLPWRRLDSHSITTDDLPPSPFSPQAHGAPGYGTQARWGLLRQCLDTIERKAGAAAARHLDQACCWAILTAARPDAALPEWLLQRVARCAACAAALAKMYCQIGRRQDAVSWVAAAARGCSNDGSARALATAATAVRDALRRAAPPPPEESTRAMEAALRRAIDAAQAGSQIE